MSLVIQPPAAAVVPVVGAAPGAQFPVRRVFCVGRNYVEHAKEMGFTGREPPFFFMKPADTLVVVPEHETVRIQYPTLTSNYHHEIELVVAIGVGGTNIKAADAPAHIWGYAVGLDMTRRDLQGEAKKLGRPWDTGKSFDLSAPIGPIRAAAECRIDAATAISLEVNGKPRQQSTIGKLIWSVAEIIEHLSAAWELQPGDLIFTGTPEGVAAVGRGDVLKGSVAGVGSLQIELV